MIEYLIIGEVLMYWVICTETFNKHVNMRKEISLKAWLAAIILGTLTWPVHIFIIICGFVKAIKESTNGD